jgi:hypothetical protein
MCICCSIFQPSDEFATYLAAYLFERTKEIGVVGKSAVFSLQALDRTMEAGQRRLQPSHLEIERIEQRQPIPVKIFFLDGTFRSLLVTSQTRAQQLQGMLARVLQLNHGESFGIFELEEPQPGWEVAVYHKRERMARQAKIDALHHMPYDRELDINERIMDVVSSWTRSRQKKSRSIRLVYKCKLHSQAQESSYSRNGWKIAFLTSVWHVIHASYPMDEDDCWHLAALQLQGTRNINGHEYEASAENKNISNHNNNSDNNKNASDIYCDTGAIQDVVGRYCSYKLLEKYSAAECEARILQHHKFVRHLSKADAHRKYIASLRKCSSVYFGASFFRCVRVSRLRSQAKNEKIDLVIGISENGLTVIDPLSQHILERYKMEEILTYGFRSRAFLFVAGTLMTQKKCQFATMVGKQMNDLLRAHIDLRVLQAEVQGYEIQH